MRKRMVVSIGVLAGSMVAVACGSDDPAGSNSEGGLGKNTSAVVKKSDGLCPHTQFYVPPPNPGAVKQVAALIKARDLGNAARIAATETIPKAVWFTDGTPKDVKKAVSKTMSAAAIEHRVPVLVSYNIPFRDCAQYSAGGAVDTVAYKAWIDGFAAGIGKAKAVVILEPDSVGIIPYNTNLDGTADWCKPTVTDAGGNTVPAPGADPASRYAQLNYALDSIASKAPNALVYLDATHSAWLNVGEAAYRLTTAGVAKAQGFYLNTSNYQFTTNSVQYGTWISDCIAYATLVTPGDFSSCVNQYWNGGPLPAKIAELFGEWNGVAMSPYGEWSDDSTVQALNTSGINLRYGGMLGTVQPTTHFVIDTSRNGRGPMDASAYAAAPYNQPASVITALTNGNWCNPPSAGLGPRPTANTGVPLVDAYLWVKIPGESDGSCNSAGGARAWDYSVYNPWNVAAADQANFDPLWGMVDPAAGAWFEEQTLQLVKNADPPILNMWRR